jgi:hypothetical protein
MTEVMRPEFSNRGPVRESLDTDHPVTHDTRIPVAFDAE